LLSKNKVHVRSSYYLLKLRQYFGQLDHYRGHNYAKPIPIYIQQDATLHSLFISGNCSTCFGLYLHPSSGAHTTVSTTSSICHTVSATCCYRGGVGTTKYNVYGSVHRKYISIYIQQDIILHSLFISGNCCTCFGWYLHPALGAQTTVSTVSGICHTVTAICRCRGGVGTEFQLLHDSGR